MKLAVLGATGSVGREVVAQGLAVGVGDVTDPRPYVAWLAGVTPS